MADRMTRPPPGNGAVPTIIGWMEMVDLPDLGLDGLMAKIDTSARTSALRHIVGIVFRNDPVVLSDLASYANEALD